MEKGTLTISLDFELLWGIFDKVDPGNKRAYFHQTREVIPKILDLFRQYKISCTWATVGMLFNENWEEWEHNIPNSLPDYHNQKLSAYNFGRNYKDKNIEAMCFAPGLIQLINDTPQQELATHTYSHFYCSEAGQTSASFRADLEKAIFMAEKINIQLKSLVFPRNQLNDDYLKICNELGIENVRSNADNWYWKETQDSSLSKKIFRTGDAYIGLNDKSYSEREVIKQTDKPSKQKASRLLRPYTTNMILNYLKLARIKSEMTTAAKNKHVYHLWWHPHNFGDHPEENLVDLEVLLKHYDELRKKYGFQSVHMAGLNSQINNRNDKLI